MLLRNAPRKVGRSGSSATRECGRRGPTACQMAGRRTGGVGMRHTRCPEAWANARGGGWLPVGGTIWVGLEHG